MPSRPRIFWPAGSYTFYDNGPGYILLLAAVTSLIGNAFVAGKLMSAVATALFAWLIFSLLKALFDSRIAFASTLLLLISLLYYSFVAAIDAVGALAMILPIWIFLRKPVITVPMSLVAGIFSGVAYLVRYNAIFVPAGLGFALLFINPQDNWQNRRVKFSVFLCGVLLAVAPWLLVNAQKHGSPFAGTAHFTDRRTFLLPNGR